MTCATIEQLQALCAAAYQAVGAADGPVEMLDNLSAAANGDPLPHDPCAGLPWVPADAERIWGNRPPLTPEQQEALAALDRLLQHCSDNTGEAALRRFILGETGE